MSQVSRQEPGENDKQNRSDPRQSREQSRYEGFEGMNYEQKRRPYYPMPSNLKDNNNNPREEPQPAHQD